MRSIAFAVGLCGCSLLSAQDVLHTYTVKQGTRVPMVMINSVSTKHAAEGDRVYLETSYPILSEGKIVIPPGSYVAGTITASKRAGRVKGRAELYLRFDSLTLPNGVTRDFRARVGGLDGRSSEELDKSEGKIKGETTKGEDASKITTGTTAGASVGAIATRSAGGAGLGAVAGAAAGAAAVLLTRGADVVLGRGTVVEMVLDRPLEFSEVDVDFSNAPGKRALATEEGPQRRKSSSDRPRLGFPN